ncbi:hypothetical protein Csa_006317, partial [Cucumis sativus]
FCLPHARRQLCWTDLICWRRSHCQRLEQIGDWTQAGTGTTGQVGDSPSSHPCSSEWLSETRTTR